MSGISQRSTQQQQRPVETRRASSAWDAKHTRILAAAMEEFIALGFNGASMDRIATKAKVSKVTVYNHFETKDLLYRATIAYYLDHVHPRTPPVEQSGDRPPREILTSYLTHVLDATASSRTLGMIRLLRADPSAFSESEAAVGEARLLPDTRPLATYLALEARDGRLRVANPEVAARQLHGMLFENTIYRSLLGARVEQSPDHLGEIVGCCVDTFLSHYGAGA